VSGASPVEQMGPDDAVAALFLSSEGVTDPAPLYHHLRATAPVHHSATGAIFLTRFEDCDRVLRDGRFGKRQRDRSAGLVPQGDEAAAAFRQGQIQRLVEERRPVSMLFLDPPHHTRQRRLVSRAFTPRRVEALRGSIRVLADRAVDALVEGGGGDLLETVAFPLPVAVIGTMVGVPEADWPRFRSLISAAAVGIEPGASLEDLQRAEAAGEETATYFLDLIAERRRRPQEDLLSGLIAVEEAGDTLSEGEVAAVSVLLFAAGFETTTNLIGNGVAALLAHPDQMDRLRRDPALIPTAVDEMLRWDSPVQVDVRRALVDTEIGDRPVEDGQAVVTLLGAANRDPDRFADPDHFDVGRKDGPPLSFAAGIHHCLGANLARAEGQEVFRSIIERCATLDAAGPLVRRHRMTLRGYQTLPVTVTGRGAAT
jgi:cytochrome P450